MWIPKSSAPSSDSFSSVPCSWRRAFPGVLMRGPSVGKPSACADGGRARGGPGRFVDGQAGTTSRSGGRVPPAVIPAVMGEGLKPLKVR